MTTWILPPLCKDTAATLTLIQEKIEKALKANLSYQALTQILETLDAEYKQVESYILCLMSENTENKGAFALHAKCLSVEALLQDLFTQLDALLLKEKGGDRFFLKQRQLLAKIKLPKEQEELISALSIDGYHGYATLYEHLKNKIVITGYEGNLLSYPEAENALYHKDRKVREHTHHALNAAFEKEAPLFAEVLGHLSGFRLEMYKKRKWDDILLEPLHINHMEKETLEKMFLTAQKALPLLQKGLKAKAKLLHLKELAWFDIEAPIEEGKSHYSFEEGSALILEVFKDFGPKLFAFAKRAIEAKWIESENRKNKRAGAFCTSFPLSKESRIFMTYQGTFDNVITLAHELGHAFHSDVLFSLPHFDQHYPMSLAEMASTMKEQMLLDGLFQKTQDKAILHKKLGRHFAYLMNLPCRFHFECALYKERQKGFVDEKRLCELMLEAQAATFGNLSLYAPFFWASKLHFYFTNIPFYNFPYTFGYLFSLGAYALFSQDPKSFEERYIALLQDSGCMSVEELIAKHFEEDLFEAALKVIENDIQALCE